MQKITFTDNSYIEKNTSGNIAVGVLANTFIHILHRTNGTIENIPEALRGIKNGMLIIKEIK